jgi:hypothetical protein
MTGKVYSFLLLLAVIIPLMSYYTDNDISYENSYYKLTLNKNTGSIRSILKDGNNMLYAAGEEAPLFNIRFRDV